MNVRSVEPGARIDAGRAEVVVCIPVYGAHDLFVTCLQSVLAHTPPAVPILVCDDASPDRRSREYVAGLDDAIAGDRQIFYSRREENVGFPANVNGGFEAADPADVVLLNSDCLVAAGWLEGLRDAAYSGGAIATATALTNHGSVLSVPEAGTALSEPDRSLDDVAAAVRERSLRLRPHLLTAVGHCVYVRRDALDLVGEFDVAFTPGYGEEVDFSQRCLNVGLGHVVADDVLVFHHGGASLGTNGKVNPVQHEHERMIAARYPYYHDAVRTLDADRSTPLARSLAAARRALGGLWVAIDARWATPELDGARREVLEMVTALEATGKARVSVVVPTGAAPAWKDELDDSVEILSLPSGDRWQRFAVPADVVHRPHPVSSVAELNGLSRLGDRLVVTLHDLAGYRNPTYYASFLKWDRQRSATRGGLATADRIVFSSARARDEAVAEQLVEPGRTSVVHPGVDRRRARVEPAPPSGVASLPGGAPAIVCLDGHRRRFALQVFDELRRGHDWPGWLVLAGASLGSEPHERVVEIGPVSEAQRAWLLERADLVLHPAADGGWSSLPFEAAERDSPCLWSPATAMSEVLPDDAAGVVPWDAAATAARAHRLLQDAEARRVQIEVVRNVAPSLSWEVAAQQLIEVYNLTCDEPPAPAGAHDRSEGLMREHLSDDAIRLVGPYGVLGRDLERPLLALATHPSIGQPVFRAIKAGYRVSNRLRRMAGRPDPENGAVDPEP